MFKRIELHNHSTESDGKLSVAELIAYFHEKGVKNFALTDHNTLSGFRKLELPEGMDCIKGCEVTTYDGHFLCLGIKEYLDWSDIRPQNADLLLRRAQENTCLLGLAHPITVSRPIGNGTSWAMRIHDWSLVDYIEIINHGNNVGSDTATDNDYCIKLWESLVFRGFPIAAVSGIDLHAPVDWSEAFTTYMDLREYKKRQTSTAHGQSPLLDELSWAIKTQNTLLTRGPLCYWKRLGDQRYRFELQEQSPSPSTPAPVAGPYELQLLTHAGLQAYDITAEGIVLELGETYPVIPKLYAAGSLVAVAPVISNPHQPKVFWA